MREEKSTEPSEEFNMQDSSNRDSDKNFEVQRFKARFESPEWMLAQLALDFVVDGNYEKAKQFAEVSRKIQKAILGDQEKHFRDELDKFKKSFFEISDKHQTQEMTKPLADVYQDNSGDVEIFLEHDEGEFIGRYEALLKAAAGDKWHSGINLQNLREESEILARLEEMAKNDNSISGLLWDLILNSREIAGLEIASANAMTLLNRLGTNFSGLDLSEVQIPGADLRGGNFHETNFTGANLEGVWFHGAWTNGAKVCGANLKALVWGESAPMMHPKGVNALIHYQPVDEPEGYWLSGCNDGNVYQWSTYWHNVVNIFNHSHGSGHGVYCVAVHPRARQMASGGWDECIRLWSFDSGHCLQTFRGHCRGINSIAYNPEGTKLASASADWTIRLWSVEKGECMQVLEGHSDGVDSVAYHPEGKQLASGSKDRTVRVWSLETGVCVLVLKGDEWVSCVAYHPKGRELVSMCHDKVYVWSIENGECLRKLRDPTMMIGIKSLAYHPEGKELAVVYPGGQVRIWLVEEGKCIQSLLEPCHRHRVACAVYNSASQELVSGGVDNTVRVSSLEKGRDVPALKGHSSRVTSVAYHPMARMLVSGSASADVFVSSIDNGECLRKLKEGVWEVTSVAYHPIGDQLASGCGDICVRVWSVDEGKCLRVLEGHSKKVTSVAYHPRGNGLASGSQDGSVRIWSVEKGKCVRVLESHSRGISSVAYHPNGDQLAAGSWDNTVRVWSLEEGNCIWELKGHSEKVTSVAYHPAGKELASGSDDNIVRVWSLEEGNCIWELKGHSEKVTSVVYHPSGAQLASGSEDKTVRLWNSKTGACARLLKFVEPISACAFHPTGSYFTVAYDKDIAHFEFDVGKVIKSVSSPIPIKLLWRTGREANFCDINVTDSTNCSPTSERLLSYHKSVGKPAHPLLSYQPMWSFFKPIDRMASRKPQSPWVDIDKHLTVKEDCWLVSVARQKRDLSIPSSFGPFISKSVQHTFLILEGIKQQRRFITRAELIITTRKEGLISITPIEDIKQFCNSIKSYEGQQWEIPADVGRQLLRNIIADSRRAVAYTQELAGSNEDLSDLSWCIKHLKQLGEPHIDVQDRWSPILGVLPQDATSENIPSSVSGSILNSND